MHTFIKTRLNKDNFWNLMFWLLPSLAIFIAQLLMDIIPGGFLILLITLFLAPYLVSKANKVEYTNDMFLSTSTNRVLCQYIPKNIGFVLWSVIPFTVFWILFLHKKQPSLDENLAVYNMIFWFVPTLYFILKNYPISIIFNKIAWAKGNNNHYEKSPNRSNGSNQPLLGLNGMRNDPINSWSSTNIYHKR